MTTVEDRFFAKVDVGNSPAGCWMWTASTYLGGYGQFRFNGQATHAHRAAYDMFVGPVPEGHDVDHLCRERACVNPLHLEAVSRSENNRRGLVGAGGALRQRAKTHCPQGHPYDDENTYVTAAGGRACRVCRLRRTREWNHKVKVAA